LTSLYGETFVKSTAIRETSVMAIYINKSEPVRKTRTSSERVAGLLAFRKESVKISSNYILEKN